MTVCGLSYAQNFCSHHEHCVSKAEKTVFFLYSNLIGIHRLLIAVESGNQHNQRAFRQMKIGNQPIYTPERKTWIDENIRPPAACANFSIMIACNAFQCAAAGRSHCDHAPTLLFGILDQLRSFFRHPIMLGMHVMIFNILRLNRPEGADANMQR